MSDAAETIIRYDGPGLADHEMDIEALAPALLALASLIQLANTEINGDRAPALRVVVNANVEQKCFQIKLKAIQTIIAKAKGFFDGDDVATVKTLLEWIGLVGAPTFSLFKVLKMLAVKQPASTALTVGDGATVFQITGDVTFNGIPPEVQKLLQNAEIVDKARGFLKPVEREGYESVSAYDGDGHQAFHVDKAEASAIIRLPSPELADVDVDEDGESTEATGPAWVDTSHFRGTAKWALMWNGVKIDAKMPDGFLAQFQANDVIVVPNTKLTVKMLIIPKVDENGNPIGATRFEVTDVLKIELPPKAAKQSGLFDSDPSVS
jgi:hypothetical protein